MTAVEDLLRELAPQVLGVLARRYGDFAAAEDATQEALIAAVDHWARDGVPEHPRGWLVTTAARRLVDAARSEQARRRREDRAARREPPGEAETGDEDDTLTVLFLCCHPALADASAIALTLRAVGGLSTAEIARAFLVSEATMAQRISRAKQRIKVSGEPFRPPAPGEWPQRLKAVLRVLYLIYNEGHLHRADLSAEAIRLTRLLHRLLPEHGEVAGLLALLLLTEARRPARAGALVPLAEQDRRRWDRALIAEGTAVLNAAFARGTVGEYQLQAAIAALHDRAADVAATDWPQIRALYGLLERITGSPVVALNRAIAEAMVDGPAAGLRALDELADRLPGSHRITAARAHLHELAGDLPAALAAYRQAAAATTSLPERAYLVSRAARLTRLP